MQTRTRAAFRPQPNYSLSAGALLGAALGALAYFLLWV
jgi:hypothetical protein